MLQLDLSGNGQVAMIGDLRAVDTIQIAVRSCIGEISGEFWSDDLCGVASPIADAERRVTTVDDLAVLLTEVAVPEAEAALIARRLWDDEIGPQREAWR